jgi:hypothetical protein
MQPVVIGYIQMMDGTWVSDYAWGWAAFHYGNWFYDQAYGWMWLPDYEWAPAWVTWGEYDNNYCWAPIGPHINIGVSFDSYRPPVYYWTFVPRTYITSVNINRYYVNRVSNTTIVNNITVINNINKRQGTPAFMRGPQSQSVERYTHAAIRPVPVRETSAPGRDHVQNGQLAIYRPSINRNNSIARPAPARVEDVHHLQPGALPAINRHVQPNNVNENKVIPKPVPGHVVTKSNVEKNPVINSPVNSNPVPHTNKDANHPVNPAMNNHERNIGSNKNKQTMNPSPGYKPVNTPPANRPANTPPVRSNHPTVNPNNPRSNPDQHIIQQPRLQPAPLPNRPPVPAHNRTEPSPTQDQRHK